MNFTLIICTYKRPKAIVDLLDSVMKQILLPTEILIIDGSPDENTRLVLEEKKYARLQYHKVPESERGLTKQRNYGISRVATNSEIICFLDDDTILDDNYFSELISTYSKHPDALGVGGYITNEVQWKPISKGYKPKANEFVYDGYKRADGSRFVIRKKLGLDSNVSPGWSPAYSHGRSVGFLPPSGKIYPVEQLMGGVSSFRKSVFETMQFSTYFEGYGLYEDADFTLRLAKKGALYINTRATLGHYHDAAGRPNKYQYGKMVVRNGWYVWRVKNDKPNLKDRLKWNAITLLLTIVRATNIMTDSKKKEALSETLGRFSGWISLFFNKPKHI